MLADGFQIKQINDYSAVFGKLDRSISGALLSGSKYDSTPEVRVLLTTWSRQSMRFESSVA